MKKTHTLLFCLSLLFASQSMAQSLEIQAETQTREMAAKMDLNEAEFLKLKQANQERLQKIDALAGLKEKDNRYLDLRLDQIEEIYVSFIFNTLNARKFATFMKYRKNQPFTYAGLTMKNSIAAAQNGE